MITYVEKVKFRRWRHEEDWRRQRKQNQNSNEIKAKHQNQSEARNKIRFKWNEMK